MADLNCAIFTLRTVLEVRVGMNGFDDLSNSIIQLLDGNAGNLVQIEWNPRPGPFSRAAR